MGINTIIPPQVKNKCDYVVDQMLKMLSSKFYQPGEKLPPESYFVDLFGVSRVTLRESFKKLSMMGIISIRQGEGTFVNQVEPANLVSTLYPFLIMNRNNVEEMYEARRSLEIAIAEVAVQKRTNEDVDAMRDLVSKMEACVASMDIAGYNDLDRKFHERIAHSAHNSILLAIYELFSNVRNLGIEYSNASRNALETSLLIHHSILDALQKRDEKYIGLLITQHLNFSQQAAKHVYCEETETSKES